MGSVVINYVDRRLVVRDDHGCTYQDSFENFAEDTQREVPETDVRTVMYHTTDGRIIAHTHDGSQTELKDSKLSDFLTWCLSTSSELQVFCENRAPSIANQTVPKSITARVTQLEATLEALQHMVLAHTSAMTELSMMIQKLQEIQNKQDTNEVQPSEVDDGSSERPNDGDSQIS